MEGWSSDWKQGTDSTARGLASVTPRAHGPAADLQRDNNNVAGAISSCHVPITPLVNATRGPRRSLCSRDSHCDLRPRAVAGTSSFGMSGVNAHMLLGAPVRASDGTQQAVTTQWHHARYWPVPPLSALLAAHLSQPGAFPRPSHKHRPAAKASLLIESLLQSAETRMVGGNLGPALQMPCWSAVSVAAERPGGLVIFATDLSAAPGLAYLRDHIVSGRALMPGTGCAALPSSEASQIAPVVVLTLAHVTA